MNHYTHDMRAAGTASEQRLWEAVRARRLGVEFRRQVPLLGRFIVDLLAPAARLVVEIDGPYHDRRQRADARREEKLRRAGYRVMRVSEAEVLWELGAVVGRIRDELTKAP